MRGPDGKALDRLGPVQRRARRQLRRGLRRQHPPTDGDRPDVDARLLGPRLPAARTAVASPALALARPRQRHDRVSGGRPFLRQQPVAHRVDRRHRHAGPTSTRDAARVLRRPARRSRSSRRPCITIPMAATSSSACISPPWMCVVLAAGSSADRRLLRAAASPPTGLTAPNRSCAACSLRPRGDRRSITSLARRDLAVQVDRRRTRSGLRPVVLERTGALRRGGLHEVGPRSRSEPDDAHAPQLRRRLSLQHDDLLGPSPSAPACRLGAVFPRRIRSSARCTAIPWEAFDREMLDASWLAQMESSKYELTNRIRLPMPRKDHSDRKLVSDAYVEVFRFMPRSKRHE